MVNINTLNGGNITITTTPPATPSPYFAYDENRVITGLYQGSPNIQAEGGWSYGGSNVVENYATAIGNRAFDDTDYVMGSIPPFKGITGNITFQNVTSIGNYAFIYCTSLASITMPNVTSIGDSAFSDCSYLSSVTIPDSLESIGEDAFFGCSLTSVTITENGGNANNVKQMLIDAGVPSSGVTWNMPN